MFDVGQAVLVDGTIHGVIMQDKGRSTVMIRVGNETPMIARSRVSDPASHLGRNETPGPANAHYGAYGAMMSERLAKRGK